MPPRVCDLGVSIVVPIYNEVEDLPDLVARIGAAMSKQTLTFELIAVDDGSTDGSHERLCELAADPRYAPWLRAVFMARNYGKASALQAGFERVRGRYVVTIDADLQNEPEDILPMLERLQADPGVDMVSGWRQNRKESELARKFPSRMANRLISRATGVRLHDYGCALKAYRRPIIDRIHLYGELHRFIPSLARDAGARNIVEVPVRDYARLHGVSKYAGIDRAFRVILDLILVVFYMRYRQRPLHAFGGIGLWLAAPGVLVLLYLLVCKIAGQSIGGRPLLLLGVMLLLMGVQLIVAGLLGEILTRTYHEAGGAPPFYAEDYEAAQDAPAPVAQAAPER